MFPVPWTGRFFSAWLRKSAFVLFAGLWSAPAVYAEILVTGPMPGMKSFPGMPTEVRCHKNRKEGEKGPLLEVRCPDTEFILYEGKLPVQHAFNQRNFEELDRFYDQWCTGKDRFPDGRWKLHVYEYALGEVFNIWNRWAADLEALKRWQKSRPQSDAALYAEAIYWYQYAWKARGSGYASSVSREGWELFKERLANADALLVRLDTPQAKCAAPVSTRIDVMMERGASDEELFKVYSDGIRRFPEYHQIYFSMARHYQPKWGGSPKQYDTFANHAAQATKDFEGMGMYARIYWLVDYERGIPFYEQSPNPPEWKKLHAGYEDLMRKYPNSIHNRGKYLGVACRTRDSALYRALRTQMDGYEDSATMLDSIDVCDRRHQWTAP